MPSNEQTSHLMATLWTEEHIFYALDPRISSFFGAHCLFKNVEAGIVRVYGVMCNEDFKGIVFGNCPDGESFVAHVAFLRKFNVVEGCLATEKAMIDDYAKDGIKIKRIIGNIPSFNRAAIWMAKRFGCIDMGIDNTIKVWHENIFHPCHVMIKELR